MLEILFFMASLVLVILQSILIILFIKHLKFMEVFIEEMRRDQIVTHKEIDDMRRETPEIKNRMINNIIEESQKGSKYQEIKESKIEPFNLSNIKTNMQKTQIQDSIDIVNDNQAKPNIARLTSSQVSEEQLLEMLKGTEQIFSKQINVNTGDMVTNLDIKIQD